MVVEVGKASLKIAGFWRSSTKLTLIGYSFEKIDPAANAEGQIIQAIRIFLKKNSFSVKEAILSVADADSMAIKYCLLPALKHKEILSAGIWQLKDEVHFDLSDAYSDWRIVKELIDEEGAHQQGIIFAFSRKEAVEKYITCLARCNLQTAAIVTSAFSYADVLRGMKDDKAISSEIILDLEYIDSSLNLYVDKTLHFTRYLPVSVEGLTRSLVGTLISDKGKVELTFSEAEKIRDLIGIPLDESIYIKENLQASQIASLIRPVLESLVRETKHSITYFTSNLDEAMPQAIYIAGLGANLKNFDTYLTRELGFPVSQLSFPDIVDVERIPKEEFTQARSQLVSCVGAVLSAGRGVSLLAGDVRMRWFKNVFLKRLKPFAAVIGAFLLVFMLVSIARVPIYSYRLSTVKSYFQNKKALLAFFQKVQQWRELVFEVSLQRMTADALLNFISQSVPDGLRLDELELDQYQGELIFKGEAREMKDVENFIGKLKASEYFSLIQPVGEIGKNFKIKCKLTY